MTRHLLYVDFSDQGSLENQGIFQFKTYCLFKTPKKKHLDKPIHGHRKPKLFAWTDLSPWARRRGGNLGQTPLMKWNLLALKLTIFMARIVITDEFLSLLWNLASLSLFSYKKKRLKNKENKVWY